MTLEQVDTDLNRFTSFDALSNRVGYWGRRLALTKPPVETSERFDSIVAKHSQRVMSVMRAG